VSSWRKSRRSIEFVYPGADLRAVPKHRVTLMSDTHRAIEIGRSRLLVTAGLFTFAFLSISVRLVDLMVLNGVLDSGPSFVPATEQRASDQRADIVDRNGRTVATTLPTVNLYADATEVRDVQAAADALLTVWPHLNRAETARRLSSDQRFIYLMRHLSPAQQIEVNTLGIPGLYFENAHRRIYPYGPLFSHVLGSTDPDNLGQAGLELSMDKALSDADTPLTLSLHSGVQTIVRNALSDSMDRFSAIGGAGVVMDAHNGEVIALVSLPDYDPRDFNAANRDAQFNRATLGLYEMGSTFKLFTAAMALDANIIAMDSVYDARTPLTVARYTIDDYHAEKRWLTVPEILIHSSNIGAAKIALDAGTALQQEYLHRLGLLTPLPLELPEVGQPMFPSVWREINTVTISYGHGIAVTPVHVASAVSAMVNGGILYRPTLLRRESIPDFDRTRVISEQTSDRMRELMRMVVTHGSGKQAEVEGYVVGGKTGSAEKLARAGGYSEDQVRTSFVGAFPMHAPRYVVLVLLDEPQGIKETYNFATAGWNAAPTVGRIIAEIAPLLGVYPTQDRPMAPMVGGLMEANARLTDMTLAPAGTGFGGDRAPE
jgi:cell division protein FtsI (penicillin-binding protein 3)